jgi:hypothetical protein
MFGMRQKEKLRALSGARVDVDTFAVKMSSLTVVTTSERWQRIPNSHSSSNEKISEIFAESSTQAAVRQLDFNEWHLTELWLPTVDR